MSNAGKVEIFTKDNCMYCQKAKALFNEHGVPYTEYDVSRASKFSEMKKRLPNARTVPQIIIDGHLIGGFDVLNSYKDQIFPKLKKDLGLAS